MAESKLTGTRKRGYAPLPVEPRFWARVEKHGPDECWLWTGGKNNRGYGYIRLGGRNHGAHRVAAWLTGKLADLSDKGHILHTCDRTDCVNPTHLFVGDQSVNMQDSITKGRNRARTRPQSYQNTSRSADWCEQTRKRQQGAKSHLARISEPLVRRIFELRLQGLAQAKIGSLVGLSQPAVHEVLTRKSWQNVEGLPEIPDHISKNWRHGTGNPAAKLSEADIETIIQLRADGFPQLEIARRLGVSQATVSRVLIKHERSMQRLSDE